MSQPTGSGGEEGPKRSSKIVVNSNQAWSLIYAGLTHRLGVSKWDWVKAHNELTSGAFGSQSFRANAHRLCPTRAWEGRSWAQWIRSRLGLNNTQRAFEIFTGPSTYPNPTKVHVGAIGACPKVSVKSQNFSPLRLILA